MNDSDFPALFTAADAAAIGTQKRFNWVFAGNLILLALAAVCSYAIPFVHVIAPLQLLILLASLSCTLYLGAKHPQRVWYGTRALAESVKTMSWRYVMRAEPYDGEDVSARKKFINNLRKIMSVNAEVVRQAVANESLDQITEAMEKKRALPLAERIKAYRAERIEDQHAWYVRKAKQNLAQSRKWFYVLVLLNALALFFAVLRIFYAHVEPWPTDIFIVAAGSVLAWIETRKYQELAASYTLTAHEIAVMRLEIPDDGSESKFSTFVSDAESAFSREHTQWQARRDKE
jgi:hypothetical protein